MFIVVFFVLVLAMLMSVLAFVIGSSTAITRHCWGKPQDRVLLVLLALLFMALLAVTYTADGDHLALRQYFPQSSVVLMVLAIMITLKSFKEFRKEVL